jgi:predicted amidohydrolase|tara:strand:- start:5156 stop:6130 length:975 start_codon:yes stop_codon:yes gene_type:complete
VTFLVAAAQYPIEMLRDWAAYGAKLECWVEEAALQGARLLVFPEYAAMELASLNPDTMGDLAGSIAHVDALLPQADALHAHLAARFDVHILAGSAPCLGGRGKFFNRARLFTPSGGVGVQDKLVMTRFEREEWDISPGRELRLFDTDLGRIGIVICYDSEFPLIARALVEAGADMLLAPSCTDSSHGYWRVRIGAQARALEGQCYVVQAPTIGDAPWSPAVDVNHGIAGIYAPPDSPFSPTGVVAIGEPDRHQWVFGEIDTAIVDRLRADGGVLNVRDWTETSLNAASFPVEIVDLRTKPLPIPAEIAHQAVTRQTRPSSACVG